VRLPSFIIGGAPRSGTTWLYELLDRHPTIYMAKPVSPEPKFFLVDDIYERGLEYYSQRWFQAVPPSQLAGEKSTNYLESPLVAERIALALPTVKLVFVLRDPVERAYSNYLWSKMNGLETEDFDTALRLEPERERAYSDRFRFARPYSYFSRGLYRDLLQPYFDRFDSAQLLVLRFEDIVTNASSVAERLHGFLGVEKRAGDADNLGPINKSEKEDAGFAAHTRRELSARFAEPNRQLADLLGPEFHAWLPTD
jgi:hypothetical protein